MLQTHPIHLILTQLPVECCFYALFYGILFKFICSTRSTSSTLHCPLQNPSSITNRVHARSLMFLFLFTFLFSPPLPAALGDCPRIIAMIRTTTTPMDSHHTTMGLAVNSKIPGSNGETNNDAPSRDRLLQGRSTTPQPHT